MTRAAKFNLIFPWERTLLLVGFILRLRQYLSGRSLWADESMLALNIVNRSFSQLFQPLAYDQGAPLGFLLVEKSFNMLLGRTEFVLRLFPLIAGLASLWLFYLLLVALRGAERRVNLLALALFAVNPQLVYYTSEAKQYIVDVVVIIILFLAAFPFFQSEVRGKNFLILAWAGLIGMWFSHPAFFALAGIGLALSIQYLRRRDYSDLLRMILIGAAWLASLALLYFINLRNLSQNEHLANYWADGFLPLPPWSSVTWLNELITYQFSIQIIPLLILILILAGLATLFKEQQGLSLAVSLASIIAFIASALQLYPVNGRLSLFLIPFGILLLGKAIELTQDVFSFNRFASISVTTLLSGYLLISPFATSFENFISPKYYEHIRPAMQVLADSWKDGDSLFVTAWAEPAFNFYAPFYRLEGVEVVTSRTEDYPNGEQLKSSIDPLIGHKRVWVLFSHVYEQSGFNERDYLIAYLDSIGEKRREFIKPGTSVYLYLYDLSQ